MISAKVLTAVLAEVQYAVDKHGEMKTPLNSEYPEPLRNLSILVEEVGEVSRALNDDDPENLKDELAQVAAVAMMWLQAIEDGTPPPETSYDAIRDAFWKAVEKDPFPKIEWLSYDGVPKTAAELGAMSVRASLRDAGYEEVGTMGGTPVWVPPEPEEPTEAERAFTTSKLPDDFYETGGGDHDPEVCSICKAWAADELQWINSGPCQLGGDLCKNPEACYCDDYGPCPHCIDVRCDLPEDA